MPRGTNAPKLCPAEPWKCSWIVSSGSPSGPYLRVISLPTIVPTTRLTFLIGSVASTGLPLFQRRLAQRQQRGVVERLRPGRGPG